MRVLRNSPEQDASKVNRVGTGILVANILPHISHADRKAVLQIRDILVRIQLVFLNVYGASESIPRNEFRQPT